MSPTYPNGKIYLGIDLTGKLLYVAARASGNGLPPTPTRTRWI